MQEVEANVLDLAGFRSKKKDLQAASFQPFTKPLSQQELGSQIENIKQSIQRINKLMAELKSISEKPNSRQ
ncbi:MAG: hypothetical protein V4591_05415 [Bdellovibrionota bacterium]